MHAWSQRFALSCLLACAAPAQAIDIVVDVFNDPAPDGCTVGHCSLREAVQLANALPGPDRIVLPATPDVPLQLSRPPVGEDEEDDAIGDLDITEDLVIAGAGRDATVILQTAADRIFDARFPADSVQLRDLTLTGGDADEGGAVRSSQLALRLENVRMHGNSAADGGAVWYYHSFARDDERLEVHASRFEDNVASLHGGAVYVYLSGPNTLVHTLIADSQFERNEAVQGGAVHLDEITPDALEPVVQIVRSRFVANDANRGGAIHVPLGTDTTGTRLTLEQSTLCDNVATEGGALWLGFVTILSRNTFCRNEADGFSGGAVYLERPPQFGTGVFLTAERNTFSLNRAPAGGAIDVAGGRVLLRGNTFVAPSLVPVGTQGTALRFGSAETISLVNNLVNGNCHYAVADHVPVSAQANLEAIGNSCRLGTAVVASQNQTSVSTSALALGALADNGGPTQTHLPGSTSVALDAANQVNCALPDQRGYTGGDGDCDIGAVERDALPAQDGEAIFANGFEG